MAVVIHWTIAKGKKAKGNRKMLNKVMTVNAFEAVMVTPVNVALCDETRKTGNVCQSIQSETKILKMWRRRIRTGLVSTQDDFQKLFSLHGVKDCATGPLESLL